MTDTGFYEKYVARPKAHAVHAYDDLTLANHYEVKLVFLMLRLMISTARREENKLHAIPRERLQVPHALCPLVGRGQRQTGKHLVYRKFHSFGRITQQLQDAQLYS
jgi:hypothetical protein